MRASTFGATSQRFGEPGGVGALLDAHPHRFRLARLAEGDAQGQRQQQREDEHPEQRLGLAQQLAHLEQGELDERGKA
jgi:hypothetical protein